MNMPIQASLPPVYFDHDRIQDDDRGIGNNKSKPKTEQNYQVGTVKLPDWSQKNHQYQFLHSLPKSATKVPHHRANRALGRIFQKINLGSRNNLDNDNSQFSVPNLNNFTNLSMSVLALAAASVVQTVTNQNGSALIKQEKTNTKINEILNQKNIKNYQDQLAKNIEAMNKAKKSGIIGLICSIVSAVVDTITAVWSIVKGTALCLSGNVISGGASITSGVCFAAAAGASIANAAVYADYLAGGMSYQKCLSISGKISIAQGALEGVGAVIGLVACGIMAQAAKSIGQATEIALKEATPKIMEEGAFRAASSEAAHEIASEIGKQVAEDTSEMISEKLGVEAMSKLEGTFTEAFSETTSKFMTKLTAKIANAFSKEGIEKMVSEAVESALKNIGDKVLEEGFENAEKQITKQISKAVQKAISGAIAKSFNTISVLAVGAANSALHDTNKGIVTTENATIQKAIGDLINDRSFTKACIKWFDNLQKANQDRLQNLMNKQVTAVQSASDVMSQEASIQSQIAFSIA